MKTSEMIAMLEKNPKLRFTRSRVAFGYGGSVHCDQGRLCGANGTTYDFILNIKNEPMDDWQLVREPVTWQEALQAAIDGKRIVCEDCEGCFSGSKCSHNGKKVIAHGFTLCLRQLQAGTWYIEEA